MVSVSSYLTRMFKNDLIEILVCPETKQRVFLADADFLAGTNAKIRAGTLKNRSQQVVTEILDGLLVREDRKVGYPVRQEIPVLLTSEAIEL